MLKISLIISLILIPTLGYSQEYHEDVRTYKDGKSYSGFTSDGLIWNGEQIRDGNTSITTKRFSNGETRIVTKTKIGPNTYQLRVQDDTSVKYFTLHTNPDETPEFTRK